MDNEFLLRSDFVDYCGLKKGSYLAFNDPSNIIGEYTAFDANLADGNTANATIYISDELLNILHTIAEKLRYIGTKTEDIDKYLSKYHLESENGAEVYRDNDIENHRCIYLSNTEHITDEDLLENIQAYPWFTIVINHEDTFVRFNTNDIITEEGEHYDGYITFAIDEF